MVHGNGSVNDTTKIDARQERENGKKRGYGVNFTVDIYHSVYGARYSIFTGSSF
jgi:hypothetical protein